MKWFIILIIAVAIPFGLGLALTTATARRNSLIAGAVAYLIIALIIPYRQANFIALFLFMYLSLYSFPFTIGTRVSHWRNKRGL